MVEDPQTGQRSTESGPGPAREGFHAADRSRQEDNGQRPWQCQPRMVADPTDAVCAAVNSDVGKHPAGLVRMALREAWTRW